MHEMTTINNGTRIRKDHNVYAEVLASVNGNVTVQGDELWTAPADGNEVKKGDQWLHLVAPSTVGWMAYRHKGVLICMDLKDVTVEPPPTPEQDFIVSVNIGQITGVSAIVIQGDETKPFNIILNERVIWP